METMEQKETNCAASSQHLRLRGKNSLDAELHIQYTSGTVIWLLFLNNGTFAQPLWQMPMFPGSTNSLSTIEILSLSAGSVLKSPHSGKNT